MPEPKALRVPDPRQIVTGPSTGPGLSPPWAIAMRGSGVLWMSPLRTGWEKIEPMLALTAPLENGSAQFGPRTTVASISP